MGRLIDPTLLEMPAPQGPMKTAFYSHSDCRGHDMGEGHPECPARLDAIEDHLIATGLDAALERREAPSVDAADLALAHSAGYVAELRDLLEEVAQLADVAAAVGERQVGEVGERCLAPLERGIEPARDQVVLDRVEPRRALRVTGAHVVAAAVGMAVEGRFHRSFDGRDFE
jgi:acetoin utilization deacetylase AcuC-like enzyme